MAAPMKHLLSWGANSYGQLGHGNFEDLWLPLEVSHKPNNCDAISGGGGHSLLVSDRVIYTCGWNNKGQLGQGHTEKVMTFTKTDISGIPEVAGGWDHTLAISGKGDLLVWGSNSFGQLGLPEIKSYASKPSKVQLEKISGIAAGLRHSLVITENGSVFAWGAGRKGQLGATPQDGKSPAKQMIPLQVSLPPNSGKPLKVVAGSYHSAILTDEGRVLIWGCNKHGQVTQDPGTVSSVPTPYLLPQEVFGGHRVLQLHSGWTHLLAVLDDGSVWSWGRSDYGQLGRESGSTHDHIPKPIEGLTNLKQLTCGSEHNLAITADGHAVSWGWNEHGICGTGDEVNRSRPGPIPALEKYRTLLVGCGAGHNFAVCEPR